MARVPAEKRDGGLIPGLPEELVLAHVVPRLPWYVRPVCRAISKTWKSRLDTKNRELELKTREMQLPLLKGVFLICTFDTRVFIRDNVETERRGTYPIQWQDKEYRMFRQWRELPPLQGLLYPPPTWASVLATSGMIYAWSNEEPNFVLKMDIGCGQWTWSRFPVPHRFNPDAVDFNGKIYVPEASTGDSPIRRVSKGDSPKVVLAYDMARDTCVQVESWYRDNLRVLPRSSQPEAMYSFIDHDFAGFDSKLELLVYDACGDSWKTEEDVPIPQCRWSELAEVKLLNGECFEPASEVGTNIVWIDHEGQTISWFNSALGKDWVDIDYNPFLEGKCLEFMHFVRGSLYGIFIEEEEEVERRVQAEGNEEKENWDLSKRTMMKGRISVERSIVEWEELFEVGFFHEKYYLCPAVVSPIDCYTLMS